MNLREVPPSLLPRNSGDLNHGLGFNVVISWVIPLVGDDDRFHHRRRRMVMPTKPEAASFRASHGVKERRGHPYGIGGNIDRGTRVKTCHEERP